MIKLKSVIIATRLHYSCMMQLLDVLCRSSTLNLATLSSHIDTALDLALLDYSGSVNTGVSLRLVSATLFIYLS